MLVLSRKKFEVIQIGENIQIKVVGLKNGAVQLGIEAPKTVPVNRLEVLQRPKLAS